MSTDHTTLSSPPVAAQGAGSLLPGATVADVSSQNYPAALKRAAGDFRRMGPPRTFDHDAILDLWAAGNTTSEIAATLDIKLSLVGNVIRSARKRGDPRAPHRKPARTPEVMVWHDAALADLRAGDSVNTVAARYGRKPNVVRWLRRKGIGIQQKPSCPDAPTIPRDELMARFWDLLAEHGSLRAIARATGFLPGVVRRVSYAHGRVLEANAPRPAGQKRARPYVAKAAAERAARPAKVKPAPKPKRNVAMSQGSGVLALIRAASSPKKSRPEMVDLPDCDDPKIARIREILLRDIEAEPFDVRRTVGCELRLVYQVRFEIIEARRAA